MDDGDLLVTSCDLCPVLGECRHSIIPDPNPDRLNLCRRCYSVMFGTARWPDA